MERPSMSRERWVLAIQLHQIRSEGEAAARYVRALILRHLLQLAILGPVWYGVTTLNTTEPWGLFQWIALPFLAMFIFGSVWEVLEAQDEASQYRVTYDRLADMAKSYDRPVREGGDVPQNPEVPFE